MPESGILFGVGPAPALEIVVAGVLSPGPADGRLFFGDVVAAVNAAALAGLSPLRALRLLLAPRPRPDRILAVRRDGETLRVELRLPPSGGGFGGGGVAARACATRAPRGRLSASGLFKLASAFGLVSAVLSAGALTLRVDALRPGHSLLRDGPLEFGWEDFRELVRGVAEDDECHERACALPAGPAGGGSGDQAASAARARLLARLAPGERRLGALCLGLSFPRYDGPEGPGWVRGRFMRAMEARRAAAEAAAGGGGGGGGGGPRDPRVWGSSRALLEADGLHEYVEACRAMGLVPLRAVREQALSLSPVLRLSGVPLSARQVRTPPSPSPFPSSHSL
jgi:hypothetical protein